MKFIFLILVAIALNADGKFLCSSINAGTEIKTVCYKYKLFYKGETIFASTNRCRCTFKKIGGELKWIPKVIHILK